MATSIISKLFRPSVFTLQVSVENVDMLYLFGSVSVSYAPPVLSTGVSPLGLRISAEGSRVSSNQEPTILLWLSSGERQPLPCALQERPAVWYSGVDGRSRVKGTQNSSCSRHYDALFDRNIVDLTTYLMFLQGGFLPNVFKALSHRPAEFRAFFAYYNELMNKETGRCWC